MVFSSIVARRFSTGGVNFQLVKTPLQLFGVEGRYAMALYSAAVKQKQLEKVEGEVKQMKKLFDEDAKFKSFVLNPTFNRKDKRGALMAIFKKLNASETTQNFLGVVADNGRTSKLNGIMKNFQNLMSAHRGEIDCQIVSAKALDAVTLKEVEAGLQAFIKSGEKLNVHTKVDPSIIGGLVISIGDKYIDMSISRKLAQYEKSIREAI